MAFDKISVLAVRMARLGLLTKPLTRKDYEMRRVRYCVFIGDWPFEYAIYLEDYSLITDEIILTHFEESVYMADTQIA